MSYVKLKRYELHTSAVLSYDNTWKSIRLKWGLRVHPLLLSFSLFIGSVGGAKRNDIDLGETRYQKTQPCGKSYDAFVHYSPSKNFFRTLHSMGSYLLRWVTI